MGYPILTLETAIAVKAAIWDGSKQADVAKAFGITQPTVSRIVAGIQWPEAIWPDDSKGGLSEARKIEIIKRRTTDLRTNNIMDRIDITRPAIRTGALAKALNDLADELDTKELTTVASEGDPGRASGKAEETKLVKPGYSEEAWEDLKRQAPRNIHLRTAKGIPHRMAVMEVFANLPKAQWGEESTARLIKQVRKELEKDE